MIIYRIKFYMTKWKNIIYVFGLTITLFLVIFLLSKQNQISTTASALIGAGVGGGFSLSASSLASRKQIKSQLNIKRRNIIYNPLYDELKNNHNILTKSNKYPMHIALCLGPQTMSPHPQYDAWNRIQNDTRFLETPKLITEQMNELYLSIGKYIDSLQPLMKALDEVIIRLTTKILDKPNKVINMSSLIAPDLLDNHEKDFYTRFFSFGNEKENTRETIEIIAKFNSQLLAESNKLIEVCETRLRYENMLTEEQRAIDLLGILIKTVNTNY